MRLDKHDAKVMVSSPTATSSPTAKSSPIAKSSPAVTSFSTAKRAKSHSLEHANSVALNQMMDPTNRHFHCLNTDINYFDTSFIDKQKIN